MPIPAGMTPEQYIVELENKTKEAEEKNKEVETLRTKLNETVEESKQRKAKLKEFETKFSEVETQKAEIAKKEKELEELKLKEGGQFKELIDKKEADLKTLTDQLSNQKNEFNKIKSDYDQAKSKLDEIKNKEDEKRERIIKDLKTEAEATGIQTNVEIAEAIQDIDKLDLFYKQLKKEKTPTFDDKSSAGAGEKKKYRYDPNSPTAAGDLYEIMQKDPVLYDKIAANKFRAIE